jgi:hypothetical protein
MSQRPQRNRLYTIDYSFRKYPIPSANTLKTEKQFFEFFLLNDGGKMPILGFGVCKSPVYRRNGHNSGSVRLRWSIVLWKETLSSNWSRRHSKLASGKDYLNDKAIPAH